MLSPPLAARHGGGAHCKAALSGHGVITPAARSKPAVTPGRRKAKRLDLQCPGRRKAKGLALQCTSDGMSHPQFPLLALAGPLRWQVPRLSACGWRWPSWPATRCKLWRSAAGNASPRASARAAPPTTRPAPFTPALLAKTSRSAMHACLCRTPELRACLGGECQLLSYKAWCFPALRPATHTTSYCAPRARSP